MNLNFLRATTALCCTFSFAWIAVAMAADVGPSRLPAVSAINGKIEFQGGWDGMTGLANSADFLGGATLSMPVGDRFGIQADVAASNVFGNTMGGGSLHFFTRDPDAYLLGVTGGAFWANNANAQLIGPEFELYSGPMMFQGYGGFMNMNVAGVNSGKLFAIADVSLYATDNFRLIVGAKDIADFKSAHAGLEYQFSEAMPVSLTLDGKIGDNNFAAVDAGIRIYFGGENKSLKRRHREDDPPNRIFDVFNGAGNAFVPANVPNPEAACLAQGQYYQWINGTCKNTG